MGTAAIGASGKADEHELSLTTVVGAAASGLGVLGFVTFAGGIVLWTRFKEMGLPADHSVALVPKAELVTTGAYFLVPAVGLAGAMVLLLLAVKLLLDRGSDLVPSAFSSSAIVFITEAAFAIGAWGTIQIGGVLRLLVIALASALVIGMSVRLESLPAYCLVAFLAVGTFWIARAYERDSHRPTVIPMAYSRSEPGVAPRVEIGYFVAETSDRIVFASLPQSSRNELREFPRSETDDLEVGNLSRINTAEAAAALFAYNLCERLNHLESTTHAGPVQECKESYVAELRKAAGPSS
jgi:hypothetical protein